MSLPTDAKIRLLCENCNPSLLLDFATWHAQVKGQIASHDNTYKENSQYFREMAENFEVYVKNLTQLLEDAKEILNGARALSAPISKLPDEVLLHIFESDGDLTADWEDRIHHRLHVIFQVCRRWHNLIISTPKYWTTLLLDFQSLSQWQSLSVAQKIRVQTQRAGRLPLTLGLTHIDPLMDPLFLPNVFGRSFDQITSLKILINQDTFDPENPNVFPSCFFPPITHLSLDIRLIETNFNAHPISINLPPSSVSRLTCVKIRARVCRCEFILPWEQLVELELDFWATRTDLFLIISSLKRLEILNLTLTHFPWYFDDDTSTVTLRHLRSLSLKLESSGSFGYQMLRGLSLPSLKEIKMEIPSDLLDLALAPTIQEKSYLRSITKLDLIVNHPSHDFPQEFITALQLLRKLEVFHCNLRCRIHLVTKILEEMSCDPEDMLFPNLTSLDVQEPAFSAQSFRSLQKLLQSRVSNIEVPVQLRKALRTVVISYPQSNIYGDGDGSDVEDEENEQFILPLQAIDFKPFRYNDRTTRVEIKGYFIPGILEEKFTIL